MPVEWSVRDRLVLCQCPLLAPAQQHSIPCPAATPLTWEEKLFISLQSLAASCWSEFIRTFQTGKGFWTSWALL